MKLEEFTDNEKLTIANYDRYSVQWYNQRVKRFHEHYLDRFFHYLRHGKIIEFGCGNGDDARALIAKGYDYVGTDVSKKLVDWAQQENPSVPFIQCSIYNVPFDDETFDGFWASAVLLHIPKARIDEALKEIKRVCKQDAIGTIILKEGVGEKIEDQELDGIHMQRFFVYYQLDEFQTILEKNGFEVVEAIRREGTHTTWLAYFVRKK